MANPLYPFILHLVTEMFTLNQLTQTLIRLLQRGMTAVFASLLMATLMITNCLARVDVIPPYSVSPEINNMDISYFAKQDSIKITLYVINHEKFPVICDTQYESGPDKQSGLEQTIPPNKAVAFSYDYSKQNTTGDPHKVSLELRCMHHEMTKPIETEKPPVEYYGDTPSSKGQ